MWKVRNGSKWLVGNKKTANVTSRASGGTHVRGLQKQAGGRGTAVAGRPVDFTWTREEPAGAEEHRPGLSPEGRSAPPGGPKRRAGSTQGRGQQPREDAAPEGHRGPPQGAGLRQPRDGGKGRRAGLRAWGLQQQGAARGSAPTGQAPGLSEWENRISLHCERVSNQKASEPPAPPRAPQNHM